MIEGGSHLCLSPTLYVHVCVCVHVRERDRETEKGGGREKEGERRKGGEGREGGMGRKWCSNEPLVGVMPALWEGSGQCRGEKWGESGDNCN